MTTVPLNVTPDGQIDRQTDKRTDGQRTMALTAPLTLKRISRKCAECKRKLMKICSCREHAGIAP